MKRSEFLDAIMTMVQNINRTPRGEMNIDQLRSRVEGQMRSAEFMFEEDTIDNSPIVDFLQLVLPETAMVDIASLHRYTTAYERAWEHYARHTLVR